jgi:hypothetical protein
MVPLCRVPLIISGRYPSRQEFSAVLTPATRPPDPKHQTTDSHSPPVPLRSLAWMGGKAFPPTSSQACQAAPARYHVCSSTTGPQLEGPSSLLLAVRCRVGEKSEVVLMMCYYRFGFGPKRMQTRLCWVYGKVCVVVGWVEWASAPRWG